MTIDHIEGLDGLVAPVLIAAFDGWVSAGAAGTGTADHIADDAAVVVRFDSDALFDYRAARPTADFVDGVLEAVSFPEVTIRRRFIDGRDLLVLSGIEPNWHWQRFASDVADLSVRHGVEMHVSLGGIPWATPHTRPTTVITTSSHPDGIDDPQAPEGPLRVPGAMATVIEAAMMERGIPTVGLWARVPHYVGATYHPAVVALIERLSQRLGITIPLGSLVDDAAEQLREFDEVVAQRPEVATIVSQLEELVDEQGDVATGEELAAEIERFLRQASPDDE